MGGNCVRDPLREKMEDFVADWDLRDVNPAKGKYTWSNKCAGPGHIVARLDHFLIHSNFFLLPLSISSNIIPSTISDHKPISLSLVPPQNFGPIPFRF
jgi:exonuclease III